MKVAILALNSVKAKVSILLIEKADILFIKAVLAYPVEAIKIVNVKNFDKKLFLEKVDENIIKEEILLFI